MMTCPDVAASAHRTCAFLWAITKEIIPIEVETCSTGVSSISATVRARMRVTSSLHQVMYSTVHAVQYFDKET